MTRNPEQFRAAAEHASENPFEAAGYREGDLVLYPFPSGGRLSLLRFAPASEERPQGGAWLADPLTGRSYPELSYPSQSPHKCRPPKVDLAAIASPQERSAAMQRVVDICAARFTAGEGAAPIEHFPQMLSVLRFAEDSGLPPSALGLQYSSWKEARRGLEDLQSALSLQNVDEAKRIANFFTRQHGIRALLWRLIEASAAAHKKATERPVSEKTMAQLPRAETANISRLRQLIAEAPIGATLAITPPGKRIVTVTREEQGWFSDMGAGMHVAMQAGQIMDELQWHWGHWAASQMPAPQKKREATPAGLPTERAAIAAYLAALGEGDAVFLRRSSGEVERYGKLRNDLWMPVQKNEGLKQFGAMHIVMRRDQEMSLLLAEHPGAWGVEIDPKRQQRERSEQKLLKAIREVAEGKAVEIGGRRYVRMTPDQFWEEIPVRGRNATMMPRMLSQQELESYARSAGREAAQKNQVVAAQEAAPALQAVSIVEDDAGTSETRRQFRGLLGALYPPTLGERAKRLLGQEVRRDASQIVEKIAESEMEQGRIGDCYLFAAINALKKTRPDLYFATLERSIRRDEARGLWKVRLLGLSREIPRGLDTDGWIEVPDAKLEKWRSEKKMVADLPDLLLELAYASAASRIQTGQKGMTMQANENGKIAVEGGFGHRALSRILSPDIVRKQVIDAGGRKPLSQDKYASERAKAFFTSLYARSPERYVVTANTPAKEGKDDRHAFVEAGKSFYYRHAYSVVGYRDGVVTVQNPHDTAKSVRLALDDFLKVFEGVSYVEVVSEYAGMPHLPAALRQKE